MNETLFSKKFLIAKWKLLKKIIKRSSKSLNLIGKATDKITQYAIYLLTGYTYAPLLFQL